MAGEKNLQTLLRSMKPELVKGQYVFCTMPEKTYASLGFSPQMAFREKERLTVIMLKSAADKHRLTYKGMWSMITLTVHSDLAAVGFLAAITRTLADAGISVNPVSGHYHDHLFVQADKAGMAMERLLALSK